MDRNSKILITVFVIVILISTFLTYKRSFMDQDFIIIEEEVTELEEVTE